MASNEYDKLKEMYRLQGQKEQGLRFNEMVDMPGTTPQMTGDLKSVKDDLKSIVNFLSENPEKIMPGQLGRLEALRKRYASEE
jgi:hypothetical protein